MKGKFRIDIIASKPANFSECLEFILEKLEAVHGESFRYLIDKEGIPQLIENRLLWLETEKEKEPCVFTVCNGQENRYSGVMVTMGESKYLTNDGTFMFVSIDLFSDLWEGTDWISLIEHLGHKTKAHEVNVHAPDNTNVIYKQLLIPNNPPPTPPFGLPVLMARINHESMVPTHFAWISYWSAEVMYNAEVNVDDISPLVYRTKISDGALLMQLTNVPLDLNIPEHLKLLMELYQKFENVGGQNIAKRILSK